MSNMRDDVIRKISVLAMPIPIWQNWSSSLWMTAADKHFILSDSLHTAYIQLLVEPKAFQNSLAVWVVLTWINITNSFFLKLVQDSSSGFASKRVLSESFAEILFWVNPGLNEYCVQSVRPCGIFAVHRTDR